MYLYCPSNESRYPFATLNLAPREFKKIIIFWPPDANFTLGSRAVFVLGPIEQPKVNVPVKRESRW